MEPLIMEATSEEAELKKKLEEEEENAEDFVDEVPFTKRMREATRKIHNVSDTLVNAKLGIAMTDDRVWAEGLLIFYEVFKFLEEAVDRLKSRVEYFDRFKQVLDGLNRKVAFEMDLQYYYGMNWERTCYQIRPSVSNYIKHLKTLEEREPLRLLAYIYHMYMGLLSGGQVIKKKRDLKCKLSSGATSLFGFVIPSCMLSQSQGQANLNGTNFNAKTNKSSSSSSFYSSKGKVVSSTGKPGCAVTDFTYLDGRTIGSIKKDIVFTMNDIAEDLSKDERTSLIEESIHVFERNNEIVATIQVSWLDAFRNVATNPIVAFILMSFFVFIWYMIFLC